MGHTEEIYIRRLAHFSQESGLEEYAAAKAARVPFEKSKHGALVTYRNPNDNSKLVTFSSTDGGAAQLYKCACDPDRCFGGVGRNFNNVARHLLSRRHWNHWRLVAFGEAQPTEAAWLAFRATMPVVDSRGRFVY